DDDELVALGQAVDGDAGAVPRVRIHGLAVEADLVDGVGNEVDEGARAVPGGEGDRRAGREDPVAAREVEVDVVVLDGDERGALGGLLAGEVLSGHGLLLVTWVGGRSDRPP